MQIKVNHASSYAAITRELPTASSSAQRCLFAGASRVLDLQPRGDLAVVHFSNLAVVRQGVGYGTAMTRTLAM
jgi:hypothetical protein